MNCKNNKWLALVLLAVSSVTASAAEPLQFTNITLGLFPGLTERLNAVAYGGSTNFLAVGDHQTYVCGNFTPMQSWFTSANWATNRIFSNSSRAGSNLMAVASSGGLFVASGDNNWAFFATNSFSVGGLNWPSNNSKVFGNAALAPGAAFNGGKFTIVGEAPEIGWVGSNLPTVTNWNLSVITNPSFAESFRGVTPYGTNGFAACGVFGDVRLTSNGSNWQTAVNGKIGQPDLYGIAYDGAKTFVCVGATNATTITNGVILVSTNSGAAGSWRLAFVNGPGTSLKAVAYSGSEFVAVGFHGQVLTSTNGVAWSVVAPDSIPVANVASATSLNLNGVAFAASGFMHDIGEIVGDNGNVIITAPPPPTNNSLGNKWICVGVTTPVFENTLQVTNAWGSNIVTVDWFDAPVGGNEVAAGTFNFTPPFDTDNSQNLTNYYWAQARDLRTGFVNTNRTEMVLTNLMRPTAAMITTNTICNGDTTTIQANLAGNGPWTVYWTDGFTNYTNTVGGSGVYYANNPFTTTLNLPNAAFNPTNVFLNAATNHNYWVRKLTDSFFPVDDPISLNPTGTNWSGDLTGSDLITVNPRPTVAVVTTNTICNGDSVAVQANLTGIGPWTVHWTDGFVNYTETVGSGAGPFTDNLVIPNGTFNPTNVFLNAPTNHYYQVFALEDSHCSANSGDISGVGSIKVNPRPTVAVVTTNTICNGDSVTVQANLTGIGPWTVHWTDGFVNYTETVGSGAGPFTDNLVIPNGTFNPTNVFLNASTNHYYQVFALNDANCSANAGDISGVGNIKVNPRPTATLVTTNTICNGQSTVLQANLTGIGPWTVHWTDGFVNYTETVGSGAGPFTDSLTIPNGTFNPTNVFPNAPTNHYYQVFALNDANCSANAGDIGGTDLVTVNPRPTASLLSFNTDECNEGPVYTLTNTLTGTGPWTVYWNDGSSQIATNIGPGPVILTRTVSPTNDFAANVSSNNVYYVTNIEDANSCLGNQPGDIAGAVTNTIHPRPTASLLSFNTDECNEGSVYTLTNTLTGVGPWVITWNDGYKQTNTSVGAGPSIWMRTVAPTNGFAANAASNNVYYVASVVDADGCDADHAGDITGEVTNTIHPRPTASLLSFNTDECNEGSVYTLTNTLTGVGPWVITWNDGYKQTNTSVGAGPSIWMRTVAPTNGFAANAASNNVYYVASVVDADGCDADHAGDITGEVTNTIHPRPTASLLSFNTDECNEGSVYTLTNTLTGVGPWVITWNDGYKQTNTSVGAGPSIWMRTVAPTNGFAANAASNNVYYVASVVDADGCDADHAGDITGEVTNTIHPRPTASLLSFNTDECNEGSVYTLTNTLTGVGPWVITWNDGYKQTNTSVGAGPSIWMRTVAPTNGFAANAASNNVYYVASVVDADGCDADHAGDITGEVTNTINPRPTISLSPLSTTNCNDGEPVTLAGTLTGVGIWTVIWNDGTTQTTNGIGPVTLYHTVYPTNSLGVNSASNNVYYVTSVVDTNGCNADHAGDIMGTNTISISPRPTATVLQVTNSYYNLLTFDDLPVPNTPDAGYGIPDGYGGVNWPNFGVTDAFLDTNAGPGWITAVVSTNNVIWNYASPGMITNTAPFNLVSAYLTSGDLSASQITVLGYTNGDLAYSNVYTLITNGPLFVAFNYSNVNEVVFTNYTGADYFLMDNVTVKETGPTEEICNGGMAELQADLTGIGPWTVTWSDGYVQTTSGSLAVRFVNPTNTFLNQTTNYYYTVTSVSNADTCSGNQPGDLVGTASVTVSPRPMAVVSGSTNIAVTTTDPVTAEIQAVLTGIGPWVVSWSDGLVQTAYESPASRTVTNHLTMSTTTNYTVEWYDGPGHPTRTTNSIAGDHLKATSPYKNQYYLLINGHAYYITATNVLTSPLTTTAFTYSVTNLTDGNCMAGAGDLTGAAVVRLVTGPAADVYAAGSTNLCLGDSTTIEADLLGSPPWTIYWSDGTIESNVTDNPHIFGVSPNVSGTYTYDITNLVDGSSTVADPTNLTGGVIVTVYDLPVGSPISLGSQTNCAGVANPPLVVMDTNSVTWYDTNGYIVATGTTNFIPADVAPGTYPYFAAEINSNGCAGNMIEVDLVLEACTNPPTIQLNGTNGTIQWYGDLTLQSTTNLVPPVVWQDVFTNGVMGTNTWYWTNGVPPWNNPYNFFRLFTN